MRGIVSGILVIALFAVSSAGCLSKANESSASGSPSATSGATSPAALNTTTNASVGPAPTATFSIVDNGTVLTLANGSYPSKAGVNLTFNASASTGKNLSYEWSFGDNGTATNGTAVHAFAAAGNYSVVLVVTDGSHQSANASANLTIASSGPASGTFLRKESKTFSGSYNAGFDWCGFQEGLDLITWTWTLTAAEPDGTPTVVNHLLLNMKGDTTTIEADLYINGPDGKQLGKSEASLSATQSIELKEVILKPGKYTIQATVCEGAHGTITITGVADYVVA